MSFSFASIVLIQGLIFISSSSSSCCFSCLFHCLCCQLSLFVSVFNICILFFVLLWRLVFFHALWQFYFLFCDCLHQCVITYCTCVCHSLISPVSFVRMTVVLPRFPLVSCTSLYSTFLDNSFLYLLNFVYFGVEDSHKKCSKKIKSFNYPPFESSTEICDYSVESRIFTTACRTNRLKDWFVPATMVLIL